MLFVDSADKAARFIWICDAFNIPLLFLADVPGFMIGTQVERQGIIRHGAKMISAVSEATVPKISVIVRKAYGAGLYAMAGPAFDPDAALALPTRQDRRDGAEAAVNAVFYNQIQAIEDEDERATKRRAELMDEYAEDIDILHLASELVIDAVIQPEDLRAELVRRFARYARQAPRVAGQAPRRHAGLGEQRRQVDEDPVVDDAAVALAVDRHDRHGDRAAVLLRVGHVRLGDGALVGLPAPQPSCETPSSPRRSRPTRRGRRRGRGSVGVAEAHGHVLGQVLR